MPRRYTIALVGTQRRLRAIGNAAPGETVRLLHEPDNPYDDRAIAVMNAAGEQIGYLPKGSWAGEALIEEVKGCQARITEITFPAGVRIEIVLEGEPIGERAFEAGR